MADRVLQLLGPSTGGIRQVVAALTEGLEACGWEVRNAGPSGVLAGVTHQEAVVPVSMRSSVAARRRLRALVCEVDVIHVHGLTAGWIAASLRPRPPLVVSVHNVVLDEASGRAAFALRAMEGALPSLVDATIALSPSIARRFTGSRGGGRVRVVPPAVAPPRPARSRGRVREELGIPEGVPLVVSAARLHPQKDVPTLVRALVGRLVSGGLDVRLVVLGRGPAEAEVKSLVRSLRLESVVQLLTDRSSAIDELAAADVVAVSSVWESGPLAALEAMSLGRPVVSTPVGFVADLISDGVSGRLVAIGDVDAFAAALGELLADAGAAEAMGSAARRSVTTRMGVDVQAAATETVYREILR